LKKMPVSQLVDLAASMQHRQQSAVEFEATLRERNRLAANLHDTVLQTVTGIGYQLTACRAVDGTLAADAPRHLDIVDRMVGHAVEQLRGTVWALRATSPTDRPLAEADPRSKYWGIGTSSDTSKAKDPARWPGQNRLGKLLEELRAELKE
jgi:signal transduction histidine kinase